MKSIKNEPLIKRNKTIGQWANMAGLILLAGSMFLLMQTKEEYLKYQNYGLIAMFLGFIATLVSMNLGNRFGRSPRPDEALDTALKGLPGDFTIYHFTTPVEHLLVGPGGIWALLPYHQKGAVTYRRNRWKMSGGGFMQNYMRIFAMEGIGRPDVQADSDIKSIRKELAEHMPVEEVPEVRAALVFTDESVEIDAQDAPLPAMKAKQLKEFMRKGAKERVLSEAQLKQINSILDTE